MTQQAMERQQAPRQMTLAHVVEVTGYAPTEVALVARTVAQGASFQELAVFLHACRQLRLDPLLRQAYWIRRKDRDGNYKGALQVGIDGFRAIAEGTGSYAGSEPPDFKGQIEWTYRGNKKVVPERCRVVVWKIVAGHKAAFTGEAFWEEFVPSEHEAMMYAKMPRHMLAKVAEAQALRKAFPALLGGVSVTDALSSDTPDLSDLAELPVINEVQHAEEPAPRAQVTTSDRAKAAEYDAIYGTDDPISPEPKPEPKPEPQPTDDAPAEVRSGLWQENRELTTEAAELGVRGKTLRYDASDGQLRIANQKLRIAIADAQVAADSDVGQEEAPDDSDPRPPG